MKLLLIYLFYLTIFFSQGYSQYLCIADMTTCNQKCSKKCEYFYPNQQFCCWSGPRQLPNLCDFNPISCREKCRAHAACTMYSDHAQYYCCQEYSGGFSK